MLDLLFSKEIDETKEYIKEEHLKSGSLVAYILIKKGIITAEEIKQSKEELLKELNKRFFEDLKKDKSGTIAKAMAGTWI